MDVDEVTIDAAANWTAVEKPLESKDEEGRWGQHVLCIEIVDILLYETSYLLLILLFSS